MTLCGAYLFFYFGGARLDNKIRCVVLEDQKIPFDYQPYYSSNLYPNGTKLDREFFIKNEKDQIEELAFNKIKMNKKGYIE